MPKIVKPAAPVKPKPLPPPEPKAPTQEEIKEAVNQAEPEREIIYPKLEFLEYSTTALRPDGTIRGPLYPEDWKTILKWEPAADYLQRRLNENPGSKPEQWMADVKKKDIFGDEFHCKNVAGEKIRTHNNAGNRDFDMGWCKELIHMILQGQWAGPFTVPGETVNCETVRISRYARVLSGQHEGTACILADEILQKARADKTDRVAALGGVWTISSIWEGHDHVFIETVVARGCSEDKRILMTVDYVKPRSAADVFYTSDTFNIDSDGKPRSLGDRKELCKVLASAVDMLWTRTDAKGYRTHPEIVGFLERHMRLLKCVEHIHSLNSEAAERKIGKLHLQPGHCAAWMYLMGCGSDTTLEYSDEYRNEEPPTEKRLDWSLWDRAKEFFTLLTDTNRKDFDHVRTALGHLMSSSTFDENNQGLGGRVNEKMALISRAWERWKEHHTAGGPPFDDDDLADGGLLCLSYNDLDDKGNKLPLLPDGRPRLRLLDVADFGGIDCPERTSGGGEEHTSPMPPPPSKAEIEKATQEAIERRKQKQAQKKG